MNKITKTVKVEHDDQPHEAIFNTTHVINELLEEAGFELDLQVEYNEEESPDSVAVFNITLINKK